MGRRKQDAEDYSCVTGGGMKPRSAIRAFHLAIAGLLPLMLAIALQPLTAQPTGQSESVMHADVRWAIVIAAGVILAALLHGGIYQSVPQSVSAGAGEAGGGEHGYLFRLNRFTGDVVICGVTSMTQTGYAGYFGICGPTAWGPDIQH